MNILRVMMLGDVVGQAGCAMIAKHCNLLKKQYALDCIIANGENSSNHGRGITPKIADSIKSWGVDCITTGNHIWYHKEIYSYLNEFHDTLRPFNFPAGAPGVGVCLLSIKGQTVAVVNLQGRVFMKEHVDDPFRSFDSIIAFLRDKTKIIFVDFHAEVTSEKHAMAYYASNRATAVVGTHTHVQTADERILPGGTAYITDLGMAGSLNSMLGMQKEPIITNFLSQMPIKFVVDLEPPYVMSGVIIEADVITGRAISIERIRIIDNDLSI